MSAKAPTKPTAVAGEPISFEELIDAIDDAVVMHDTGVSRHERHTKDDADWETADRHFATWTRA